jgi:hypothetical protein
MDSGATNHITSDLERLATKECYIGTNQVQVTNGAGLSISHVDHSSITGLSIPLYLNHVLYVPKVNEPLISVRKLASNNDAFVELNHNFFLVKD